MNKNFFTTVYMHNLSIDNIYGLINKPIEIAEPVQAKMTPLTQKAFDTMNADKLFEFMKPYWNIDKKSLNTITGLFKEILERFKASSSLLADAKTIGIEEQMNTLETLNINYTNLYKTRNIEVLAR